MVAAYNFVLWLSLAVLSNAATLTRRVLHEKREHLPHTWTKRDRLDSSDQLSIHVGLAQRNLEQGEDYLLDISDPASPNYGKHWTAEEVVEKFRPADETVQAVRQWLLEHGNIDDIRVVHSDNKAWLAFEANATEIENILETEFHLYEHVSGHVVPACSQYHVAEHLQNHIDYILPGIFLPANLPSNHVRRSSFSERSLDLRSPAPQASETGPAPCYETVTPQCVEKLYGVPLNPSGPVHPGNEMGIYEDGSYYAQQDLNSYFKAFAPFIPNDTHPAVDSIDGGQSVVTEGNQGYIEATLDIEIAYPLVYPQNIKLLQTNDRHYAKSQSLPNSTIPNGFNNFLDALDKSYCNYSAYGETGNNPKLDPKYPDPAPGKGSYKGKLMCGVYKPPKVISISNAGQEADVPAAYQKRQCNEFMKLGLQGVSVLVAAGDTGVRAYPPAEGKYGCLGPKHDIFSPMWPSGCPYVTTVGATMIAPGNTVHDPEQVANVPIEEFSSGGGFSNLYPQPSYQKAALKTYFADHNPPFKSYSHIFNSTAAVRSGVATNGGVYNRIGRGIPDVAAVGSNMSLVYDGFEGNIGGGTSASTPLFAALINRINELRLAKGKTTVGFLNPTLYAHSDVLKDITIGHNTGCGIEDPFKELPKAFSAVEGWDPTTGLGVPDFEKMVNLFLSLP